MSLGEDPLAERDRRRAIPSVQEFAAERYLPHCKERLLSWDCTERYLRLRILPAMGRKAMDEVTQADVAALRRRIADAGLAAPTVNRHLACVRAMFNAAIRWGVIEGRNPAASPGMLREEHRDRYLTLEQTRALVAALDEGRCPDAAAALVLLAATGARKQEVLRARWENVDLGRCVLTVPRSKNGRPRQVALSPFALAILRRQLARREEGCPFVFPSWSREGRPRCWTCGGPGRRRSAGRGSRRTCASTICGTRLRPRWPTPGWGCSKSAPCWGTGSSPPPRATPTTRRSG